MLSNSIDECGSSRENTYIFNFREYWNHRSVPKNRGYLEGSTSAILTYEGATQSSLLL
eukprot:m.38791 g.38791  ORF g.38791 m.38791 type:complete len:58 (+) comp18016_c0_seq2:107-280(+)